MDKAQEKRALGFRGLRSTFDSVRVSRVDAVVENLGLERRVLVEEQALVGGAQTSRTPGTAPSQSPTTENYKKRRRKGDKYPTSSPDSDSGTDSLIEDFDDKTLFLIGGAVSLAGVFFCLRSKDSRDRWTRRLTFR